MATNAELVANRRRALKALVIEYMGGKCHRCGWHEHQSGLVPHHVDPTKKSFSLSASGKTLKWETLRQECDKCILLCHNCHDVVHALKEAYYFDESNIPHYQPIVDEGERKLRMKPTCLDCGKEIGWAATRCRPCAGRANAQAGHGKPPKIDWPTNEELRERLAASNYSALARELGVSDNAIRKRLSRVDERRFSVVR